MNSGKEDLDLDDPLGKIYQQWLEMRVLVKKLKIFLTMIHIFKLFPALQRHQLRRNEYERGAGGVGGAFSNVLVIGGFAAFALVVQYVFRTIANSEWNFQRHGST